MAPVCSDDERWSRWLAMPRMLLVTMATVTTILLLAALPAPDVEAQGNPLDPITRPLPGDANCDGKLNIIDAFVVGQHLDGDRPYARNWRCSWLFGRSDRLSLTGADVNRNGVVDIDDQLSIARCSWGWTIQGVCDLSEGNVADSAPATPAFMWAEVDRQLDQWTNPTMRSIEVWLDAGDYDDGCRNNYVPTLERVWLCTKEQRTMHFRTQLAHEIAHGLDFSSGAMDDSKRSQLVISMGYAPGTAWSHRPYPWTSPMEHFANCVANLIIEGADYNNPFRPHTCDGVLEILDDHHPGPFYPSQVSVP